MSKMLLVALELYFGVSFVSWGYEWCGRCRRTDSLPLSKRAGTSRLPCHYQLFNFKWQVEKKTPGFYGLKGENSFIFWCFFVGITWGWRVFFNISSIHFHRVQITQSKMKSCKSSDVLMLWLITFKLMH